MFSELLSAAAVALASSSLVAAQTHSLCNPVKGQKCPADPAVGGTVHIDFTQGASDFFTIAEGTTLEYDKTMGAVFTINKDLEAPTITSKKYIFFGKVEVVVQASYGTGIVTSSVLQSDDLDEIDWEWLGGDTAQVQTNYFSKGDTSTYDRGGYSPIANPQSGFHTYTIDWTPQAVNWIIDGKTVRTLTYDAAKGGSTFPQTPMQLKLGTWVGGSKNAAPGTVQWAGGYTNFASAPFKGYYKSVTVTDYSNGVSGATSYSYGDTSGTYASIKISTGGSTDSGSNSTSSSSTTSSSSSTVASDSKAKPTTMTTVSASNATATGTGSLPVSTAATTTTPVKQPSSGFRAGANFAAVVAAFCLHYLIV